MLVPVFIAEFDPVWYVASTLLSVTAAGAAVTVWAAVRAVSRSGPVPAPVAHRSTGSAGPHHGSVAQRRREAA
ncbi:hypothetical protein BOX37_26480 [Nocardia mangyaensis]|uniref:Uncharacterized protein n=1 Tax=Nocardia mangyaensis TaxID=2213200 RepID=A0A1J0VY11_9NOCA|nr:hypothetical protein BOX37_26480 [Nocardia mangyaensis]